MHLLYNKKKILNTKIARRFSLVDFSSLLFGGSTPLLARSHPLVDYAKK